MIKLTEKDFVVIPITEEMIKEAKELQKRLDRIDGTHRMHFNSPERWIGMLGQIGFRNWSELQMHPISNVCISDGYDFIKNGKIIDIKTQRWDVGYPKSSWGLNFPSQQINKNADYFVFLLTNLTDEIILLGFMPKDEYFQKAIFRKEGEEMTNSFIVRNDMYEILIKYLHPISKLFPTKKENSLDKYIRSNKNA